MVRLILASASSQRKTLLQGLGLTFDVLPSGMREDDHPESDPKIRAADLARLKSEYIASKHPGAVVIGCDTLVVSSKGELLEKPKDAADALRMIRLHSGAVSTVHSAVCVIGVDGNLHEGVSTSSVRFKTLSDAETEWWIRIGLWKDRSGGFQIDGLGQLLISHLEGDWTGVVGLPVFLVGRLLEEAGVSIKN